MSSKHTPTEPESTDPNPLALRQDLSDAIDEFWLLTYLCGDQWQWDLAVRRREELKAILTTILSKG